MLDVIDLCLRGAGITQQNLSAQQCFGDADVNLKLR